MKRGFIYVATGPTYVEEALRSARSLLAAMPQASCTLMTDAAGSKAEHSLFEKVLVLENPSYGPCDKLAALEQSPYEESLFLDTDTYVAGDLTGIFELLSHFDLAAAHETLRGWHYTLPGLPHAFPEFNTGVIAFRRSDAVNTFAAEWRRQFEQLRQSQGFVTDQPSFRQVAFFSPLRLAVLPSEYHFITGTPNYIMWNAALLHGRGDLPSLAHQLNAQPGARAYIPGLGTLAGYTGRKAWSRFCSRMIPKALGILFKAPSTQVLKHHWTADEASLRKQKGLS